MRNLKKYHSLFKLMDFNAEYQDRRYSIFPRFTHLQTRALVKKYLYGSKESRLRKDKMVATVCHG